MEQVAKLTADDAAAEDQFGVSVSVSDGTAIVGAAWDDDAGTDSGSAYVFERDQGGPGNWGQVAKLTADDGAADDRFGYSVSVSDGTAIVGAYFDDDAGSAYVFERDQGGPGNWGQVAKITDADGAPSDWFGISVSVSAGTAIVGARNDDDAGIDSGSAYVFERDQGGPGNWGQVAKLTADDGAVFGISVSVNGGTAIVGAAFADDAGAASGSAYVFERDQGGPGNWGQVAKLTAADGAAADYFGWSVSASGGTVIVGAVLDDDAGTSSGSAYVFRSNGPLLTIPTAIPAISAAPAFVPVELTNDGTALAGTAFSIDYDQTCLDFDDTDADADGIPDAITFHTPANFDTTVFFDLGDSDGEIDISIFDAFAPVPLADGTLVTVTFTATCTPVPPAATIAPVGFSADPAASFSDTDAQSVAGTTVDGSVEIFSGIRGDCNGDGLIDVADLVACEFEIFDSDGDFWTDVPGGTYAGSPVGCDANADTTVDAGDLTCKNRLIFGLPCAAPFNSRAGVSPQLSLPRELSVTGGTVVARIDFRAAGYAITGTVFALDYDQTRLSFDPADADLDGIPDAVRFLDTAVSRQAARFDAADTGAELSFLIADLIPTPRLLADGLLVEVEFQTLDSGSTVEAAVLFGEDPRASFGDTDGRSIPGTTEVVLPAELFGDGFESGDTSAWPLFLP